MRGICRIAVLSMGAMLGGCEGQSMPVSGPSARHSAAVPDPDLPSIVLGSAHWTVGDELRTFAFEASRGPNGGARGTFELHNRSNDARLHGRITCLTTFANYAWVGGVLEQSTNVTLPDGEVFWRVRDNGEAADQDADQASLMFVSATPGSAERYCRTRPLSSFNDAEAGNVQVLPSADLEGPFTGIWTGVRFTSTGSVCCGFRWDIEQRGDRVTGVLLAPHTGCLNVGGCPVTAIVREDELEFEVQLSFLPFESSDRGTARLVGDEITGRVANCFGESCSPPVEFRVTRR